MGKRIGALLGQYFLSPCQRYSLPLSLRLMSWAPIESIDASSPPFRIVVMVDIASPKRRMRPRTSLAETKVMLPLTIPKMLAPSMTGRHFT